MSLKQRLMSNSFTGESNLKGQEEGQGGWSREGRGEPNKDVKWSLCSGRLLSHVGQKSGKLIPPRKALSTIFPFFAVKLYLMCYSIPHTSGCPYAVTRWVPGNSREAPVWELRDMQGCGEAVWGWNCMKLFRACQELATAVSTGTRSGWGWEHLPLCGRGPDTLGDLWLSHRDQLTCRFLREAFPDPKPNLDPFSLFSESPTLNFSIITLIIFYCYNL